MAAIPALLWTSEEQCKMRELLAIIAESIADVGPRPEVTYPEASDFLPVVAVCAASIFLSALWLLVIARYTASKRDTV